jgi:hypothetical protein
MFAQQISEEVGETALSELFASIGYSEESDIAAPSYPPDFVRQKIKFSLDETLVQYVAGAGYSQEGGEG